MHLDLEADIGSSIRKIENLSICAQTSSFTEVLQK